MNRDTIAAIATAPGEAAISVIRISGNEAFEIAQKIFSGNISSYKTHTAHFGKILDSEKKAIDAVLLLIFRGPKSYTGENTVEISCHGGTLVTKKVLERVFEAGARPAQAGEFSLRAYLNGKIDLAQAEAVQSLIHAKNELALSSAEKQLDGSLSQKIEEFQTKLTDLSAILEAWVDFPEEGLEFTSMEETLQLLEGICKEMDQLSKTFDHGKIVSTGISLCLLGSPNVGKSSLMNALLRKERAIVTNIAGTTRDVIEEDLKLGKLNFRLIDTAGIRKTDEVIEKEGIRRSEKLMTEADLILLLLDASNPLTDEDLALLKKAPQEKTIVVWNKVDLPLAENKITHERVVNISAKKSMGLDSLQKAIEDLIFKENAPSQEEVIITEMRHHVALKNAISLCQNVIQGLQEGISAEFVCSDLRAALNELATIIGRNVSEDVLSAIFKKFCLGK